MDIIQKRQSVRKKRIDRITQGLKASTKKFGETLPFNFESLIIAVQSNFDCTRRVAIEYINVALYKTKLTSNNLSKESKGFLERFEIPEVSKWKHLQHISN